MTSSIDGENNLAGEAALARVEAEVQKKQASQQSAASGASSNANSGYTVVQNLMTSLDDATMNNGMAPPTSVGAANAANGYSATQNLLMGLDNITINNNSTGLVPGEYAPNALMGVDSVIATPKVNIQT